MKTLDGLMRYLIVRLSGPEYMAMVRRASWQGMTLREYVSAAFEQWKPPARRRT
jgi:predicted DNA binding CopG/RHH family protein